MDEDFVRNSCGATVGESFGLATRPESSISYDWKTNEAKGVSMDFGKQPGGSFIILGSFSVSGSFNVSRNISVSGSISDLGFVCMCGVTG